jgi:hypothetical protein
MSEPFYIVVPAHDQPFERLPASFILEYGEALYAARIHNADITLSAKHTHLYAKIDQSNFFESYLAIRTASGGLLSSMALLPSDLCAEKRAKLYSQSPCIPTHDDGWLIHLGCFLEDIDEPFFRGPILGLIDFRILDAECEDYDILIPQSP